MIGTLIGAIIAGLIIGALGRLLVPGKQDISILVTILIGVVASLAANLILGALFGYSGGGGISWWYWIVGAILAAVGIVLYGRMTAGRSTV